MGEADVSTITITRAATADEMGAEIDRRGEVIERLETALRHWREECGKLHAQLHRENAEARRLSGCLIAIHKAPETATIGALKSVAYDAALNCISSDVAEFQIERRSANEIAARNEQAEREADAREA